MLLPHLRVLLCAVALTGLGCNGASKQPYCEDPFLSNAPATESDEEDACHRANNGPTGANPHDWEPGEHRVRHFYGDPIHWQPIATTIYDDAVGVFSEPRNLALLGASLGGTLAIRENLDDQVRADTARHPHRWGEGTRAIGRLGEAPVQIPVLLGLYTYSVWNDDDETRSFGESAISAYTITGVTTLAVKGATDTDRPSDEWNNGRWGFPSFHAAGSFTLAAVVDEHYGTTAALPAYTLAGLISWTRLDDRDHDLSDVVFGAAMGYVIGHSVARNHLEGDSRVRVLPWVHPSERASGLAWAMTF